MTREAVERGFQRYLDALAERTRAQFDVARALRDASGAEAAVVDRLLERSERVQRRIVDPEIDAYRERIRHQFDAVLDYAASEDPWGAYADEVLARDLYWDALRPGLPTDRRDRIREQLLERQRSLGEAVAPLVAADADDFWDAAASVYDREETMAFIDTQFRLTDPLRRHRGAYVLDTTIDPGDLLGGLARALPSVTVEYTDEAIRAMRRAERTVIREAKDDAGEHF